MTCFSPLHGYRSAQINPETGKRGIVFDPRLALIEAGIVKFPCGQCHGCRMDRARDWSVRCHHEAKQHEHNAFITLTYDDEHLPDDYSVKLRDWQLFMMRLRKKLGSGIRFLGVGEYGDKTQRPHYHGLLFNCRFFDQKQWSKRQDLPVYKSELLSDLWPLGHHEIGSVTMQSAAYCARYVVKKVTGKPADDHYWRSSPVDGQMHRVSPEFCTMSRRPGLGSSWFDKFATDAFPSDFLIADGRRVKPPRFYLRKLTDDAQLPIKRTRKRFAVQPAQRANSTKERLAVRSEVLALRAARLVRPL